VITMASKNLFRKPFISKH